MVFLGYGEIIGHGLVLLGSERINDGEPFTLFFTFTNIYDFVVTSDKSVVGGGGLVFSRINLHKVISFSIVGL